MKASRNVIDGEDIPTWRRQISDFFYLLLDGNKSLDIPTIEGDVLTITKEETAKKARDNYKQVDKAPIRMSDEEIQIKLIDRGDCFYDVTKIKDITDGTAGQALIQAAGSVYDVSNNSIAQNSEKSSDVGGFSLEKVGDGANQQTSEVSELSLQDLYDMDAKDFDVADAPSVRVTVNDWNEVEEDAKEKPEGDGVVPCLQCHR